MSEDDSLDFIRSSLTKLIGKPIKLIVRKNGRAQPAYEGKVLSVRKDEILFDSEFARTDRRAGKFTFQVSDVHGWVVGGNVVFPLKRRK